MSCDSRYCLCKLIIVTFLIAGLLNIQVRYCVDANCQTLKKIYPSLENMKGYFRQHTLISSALVSGLFAVVSQFVLLKLLKFPQKQSDYPLFVGLGFVVYALVGNIMKYTNLFPHLNLYYYDHFGTTKTMCYDGSHGMLYQTILLGLYKLKFL